MCSQSDKVNGIQVGFGDLHEDHPLCTPRSKDHHQVKGRGRREGSFCEHEYFRISYGNSYGNITIQDNKKNRRKPPEQVL